MKKLMMLFLLSILSFQVVAKEKFELSPEDKKIMKSLDDDTLLGPDKNNDGVRDDVEYWIKKHIKDENVQKAALMYSMYYREMRKNVDSREKSNKLMRSQNVVGSCLYLLSGFDESWKTRDKLSFIVNNSKIRIRAYIKADTHYRGQSYSTPGHSAKEVCPFKLKNNK